MSQNQANENMEYHGHPNYFMIWVLLLVTFTASLVMGMFFSPLVTVVSAFAVAFLKAYFVLDYFMHLKWEPKFFWGLLIFSVLVMVFLFVGLYPDIVPVELIITQ